MSMEISDLPSQQPPSTLQVEQVQEESTQDEQNHRRDDFEKLPNEQQENGVRENYNNDNGDNHENAGKQENVEIQVNEDQGFVQESQEPMEVTVPQLEEIPQTEDKAVHVQLQQDQDGTLSLSLSPLPPPSTSYSSSNQTMKKLQQQPNFYYDTPSIFRRVVRYGSFTSPTMNICPGYLQCNMVVLRKGQVSYDFLLFCQRNPKACPLIEVCDLGSPHPPAHLAEDADLRTDIPKYCIYRNGKLKETVNNVLDLWPSDSIAFLLGCSFSFEYELILSGIPLKSNSKPGSNIPMYKTNIPCRSAGSLSGNVVVSMRPIPAKLVSKVVEITAKYPHCHGKPICIGGNPEKIGIQDIYKPDWGDPIDINDDEVPVFHACGVTPQLILMESGVDFAITHSPGHMFITDVLATCPDFTDRYEVYKK